MNRILKVVDGVNMGSRHMGLATSAKNQGYNFEKDAANGDTILFFNTAHTSCALLIGMDETDSFGLLSYYKTPDGKKLTVDAISKMARAMGTTFQITPAIRQVLEKILDGDFVGIGNIEHTAGITTQTVLRRNPATELRR